jgi:hypothetical protein
MTISVSTEARETKITVLPPTTTGSMKIESSYGGGQVMRDSVTGETNRVEPAPTIEVSWESEPKLEDPALVPGSVQEKEKAEKLHPHHPEAPAIDAPNA